MGAGSAEYIRIISVSIRLFGVIAILAFLLRVDVARGYLLISLPWVSPRCCWSAGSGGSGSSPAPPWRVQRARPPRRLCAVRDADREALRRIPSAGYRVVGACIPATGGRHRRGTTSRSSAASAGRWRDGHLADTVAITSTDELPPTRSSASRGARGRSPAPRPRAEHRRYRRPADPDAPRRGAPPHPRRDAALQQGTAIRQAQRRAHHLRRRQWSC